MKRIVILLACGIAIIASTTGCGGSGSSPSIQIFTLTGTPGAAAKNPNQEVYGISDEYYCQPNSSGCIVNFDKTSDSNGSLNIKTTDVPDTWTFTLYSNNNCPSQTTFAPADVTTTAVQILYCGFTYVENFKTAPNPVQLYAGVSPATSITITANTPVFTGISSSPYVSSYNISAQLETQVSSIGTSPDGTTITIPLNSTLTTAGTHIIAIQPPDGSNNIIGITALVVYPPYASGGATGKCGTATIRITCPTVPNFATP